MYRNKILFLPVSGPKGSGEYIRSLTIAQAITQTWENMDIKFILNKQALYAETCPFACHLIDRSPTLSVDAVKRIIRTEAPDLCIFDSSGRTSIFRMLKKMHIPTIFISSRKRPGRKASRLKWLPLISQHWIAQPTFMVPSPTPWNQLKLKLTGAEPPHVFDTFFPMPDKTRRNALKERIGLDDGPYIVFSSGGGGHHQKADRQPPEIFARAAEIVARKSGVRCVAVMGPNYRGPLNNVEGVTLIPSLANDEFIELIHDATMVVVNGGSTLVQALANKKVCVAVPTAADQPDRISKAKATHIIESADLNEQDISTTALILMGDLAQFNLLHRNVRASSIENGLQAAMKSISMILNNGSPGLTKPPLPGYRKAEMDVNAYVS